jgi:hypothetical protein
LKFSALFRLKIYPESPHRMVFVEARAQQRANLFAFQLIRLPAGGHCRQLDGAFPGKLCGKPLFRRSSGGADARQNELPQ